MSGEAPFPIGVHPSGDLALATGGRVSSLRRTIEQIGHCAREALSVLEAKENESFAIEDLEQARDLIDDVIPHLEKLAGLKKTPPGVR